MSDLTKNPDKMSEQELRNEVKERRRTDEMMFDKGFIAGVDEYASDELTIGEISEALAEAKRLRL